MSLVQGGEPRGRARARKRSSRRSGGGSGGGEGKERDVKYNKQNLTQGVRKNLTTLKIRGCFWEVLGDVWRYFWTIFGDHFGTHLGGF